MTEKYMRSSERTLQILTAFTPDRLQMGLTQLAEVLNLSKATVLRLALTLCKYGFLVQDPESKQYSLGLKLFELGGLVYASFSLRKSASSHFRELLERLDKTVFLGIIEGDELLYIDKRESPMNPIRFASNIGTRRPPHFGMLGQVLMAHLSEERVQALLQKYPLVAFTKKSITSNHDFKEILARVKKQGFAIDSGMAIEGIGGVAAPVRDFTGAVVAALGAGFMTPAVSTKELKRVANDIVETAAKISRELGYVDKSAASPSLDSPATQAKVTFHSD
jgi:IclR family transcriptional regulator, KDG regulon repressor